MPFKSRIALSNCSAERALPGGCLIEKLFRNTRAALIEDGSNDILVPVGAREIPWDPLLDA
jgi:hypothetical protein